MSIQGKIETFFLSSLLQLLSNDNKTGILQLTNDEDTAKVFIQEGTIVYATGSKEEERLGYLMRSEGAIGPKKLDKCLQLVEERQQKLGKVLVDEGYLTVEQVEKFIHMQVEFILYNLFMWDKGTFDYHDTPLNLEGQIITQLNTMELILEASRRVDELSVLKKHYPDDSYILKLSKKPSKQETLRLTAHEKSLSALIDGNRTIKQLIYESGYDEFSVYKVIYSLLSSGVVEIDEAAVVAELFQDNLRKEKTAEADLTKKSRRMYYRCAALIAAVVIIISTIVFLMLRPSQKQQQTASPAIKKPLSVQKKEPDSDSPEKQPKPPTKPKQTKPAEQKKSRTAETSDKPGAKPSKQPPPAEQNTLGLQPVFFQDPQGTFSLTLPGGYTLKDTSGTTHGEVTLTYPPYITITITSGKGDKDWEPESRMYAKLLSLQEPRDGTTTLHADHYSLIEAGGCRGYEMELSGIRNYTFSRVQLFAFGCNDKEVFIDIDCKGCKKEQTRTLFRTIIESVHTTFLMYP